ncbi:OLC1v1020459C1 [Oldenlandia corymbosa var. corymbosa]|uniref:Glycosyltransferase n=1 Tax=Oldenlandia corymbosa var. corymbosa TaxID=529605 RepID=A0AAV1EGZ1_OLDCO|nr:OLC1v1020459C1 [Oldenlandia corymbosa var. corymbosa]
MEETSESSGFKVLMFPWLAHGHISPFMELSKLLFTKKNCHIYFCSTKINLNFVKENFGETLSNHHSIELVELHLPDSPALPPQYQTTKNLPPHLMSKLMIAFQMAKSSFSIILNHLSPDLLIFDSFQSWASLLAAEKNIPAVHFATSGAATASFFYHMYAHNCSDEYPFSSIFLMDYEARKFQALVDSNKAVAEDYAFRSFDLSSEIVLIKTCRELEKKYLDHLSYLCGKELVCVGPLVQESNSQEEDNHTDIINFLNSKNQASVIYVSFGSEYFLSEEEREEIAHGLELSNVNFIWVIRFPVGQKLTIEEAVPKGFLERVKSRGIVVDGWAPQGKILEHENTGGFLSHCGWSSVMESLHFGVPVIAMPIHLDQPTNARLLDEIGVGMEVLRDENGKMNRGNVANAIKMVVLEKDGEEIRGKTREMSQKLRLKGAEEEVEAMEKIWNLCSKYKEARNGKETEIEQQEQASR